MIRIAIYGKGPESARRLLQQLNRDAVFEAASFRGPMEVFLCRVGGFDPDVVLVEITPEVTFACLCEVALRAPGAKVVLWADSISTELAIQSMQAGVRGILRKSLPLDVQAGCLRRVHAGELWFERGLACVSSRVCPPELTFAESRLLGLVSQGLKDWEIGEVMAVPEGEVRNHLGRLFQKIGVKDRFELALFGLRGGSAAGRSCLSAPFNAAEPIPQEVFEALPVASAVLN